MSMQNALTYACAQFRPREPERSARRELEHLRVRVHVADTRAEPCPVQAGLVCQQHGSAAESRERELSCVPAIGAQQCTLDVGLVPVYARGGRGQWVDGAVWCGVAWMAAAAACAGSNGAPIWCSHSSRVAAALSEEPVSGLLADAHGAHQAGAITRHA